MHDNKKVSKAVAGVLLTLQWIATYLSDEGTYLLHMSALYGWVAIVQLLISTNNINHGCIKCDPLEKDSRDCVPLHYAAYGGHLPVVKYLISECNCDAMITTKYGTTPLHKAAEGGHLSVVEYFINDCNCDAMVTDKHGATLLHYAAFKGHLTVVEYLVYNCYLDAMITDRYGATPLHKAAEGGHFSLIKYFINDCYYDATIRNNYGTTPLHKAAEGGHFSVIEYLINDCYCDAMIADIYGITPLHNAAFGGHLFVVQYLINDCKCDAMIADNYESTPLHNAAKGGHVSIVQYLINSCKCDAMTTDKDGRTPLHLACEYNYQHQNIPVIQYLLSIPAVLCSFDKSLLSGSKGTREAVALIDEYEKAYPKVGQSVNILLLGNPGAGKRTLCQAIQQRSMELPATNAQQTVQEVKLSTVGIVSTKLHDTNFGNVIIHNFTGPPEYYMFSNHSSAFPEALLKYGAVFVIFINLVQDLSQQVRFWSSIVINELQEVSSECHFIIIGSHADKVKSQLKCKLYNLESHISKELKQKGYSISSIFHLDCRLFSSNNLEPFIVSLSNLCASIRNKQSPAINLYCNSLYSLIETKISEENVCTLHELIGLCNESRQEGVPLPDDITPSLKTLHSIGLIMYLENMKDILKSWVIVNKDRLLTKVDHELFSPLSCIEHKYIASNTGIITNSALHQLFPHDSVDMLIMFFKSMKLCQEFDEAILRVQSKENLTEPSGEKLLFFPALIAEKRPQDISHQFQIGWCLKFTSGLIFSIQFLHTLLLHLAYGYAAPVSSDCPLLPGGLQRRCYVWMNGIHWYNEDGVETLIEQMEDNQYVMMLMSCQSGAEKDMIQLHNELITSFQQAYYPMLECTEYLIDPSELQYPLDKPSQLTRYKMEQLRYHISQKKNKILSEDHSKEARNISELLPIEPPMYLAIQKVQCIIVYIHVVNSAYFISHFLTGIYEQRLQ